MRNQTLNTQYTILNTIAVVLVCLILPQAQAQAADIYVDNQLTEVCYGSYSIANRDCSGSDGDAYNTIQEAANVVVAGDTVQIRGGIYTPISRIYINGKDGTETARITFTNFNSEDAIIDGTDLTPTSGDYNLLYAFQSDYLIFDGLTFRNSLGRGIRARESNNIEIRNCKVHSNGMPGVSREGILFQGTSNGLIENCEIFNNSKGFKVTSGDNNILSNNLVYNNTKFPEGADGISISDDTNIAANSANYDFRNVGGSSVQICDYNLWGDGDFVSGMDEHSLSGDPEFDNPTLVIDTDFRPEWTLEEKLEHIRSQVRQKFSLSSDSQAIDSGTIIEGYHCATAGETGDCVTWYGAAPDIGAYEYTEEAPFIYGDVNGNGEVTAPDAAMAARYAVGLIDLTPEQITKADVNGENDVTATDAALIARYAVGLIDVFPVEE